jgi:putative transport protein
VEIDLAQLLRENPLILAFVVIELGYLVGKLRIAGLEVGATTGVLLVGLLLENTRFRCSKRSRGRLGPVHKP